MDIHRRKRLQFYVDPSFVQSSNNGRQTGNIQCALAYYSELFAIKRSVAEGRGKA